MRKIISTLLALALAASCGRPQPAIIVSEIPTMPLVQVIENHLSQYDPKSYSVREP